MELCINFAFPVQCYDNILNKCAGKYCHVETSITMDVSMLRFLFDTVLNDCYSPSICQNVINNMKDLKGDIMVSFYILFGDIMSMRILSEEEENTFLQPPTSNIYDTLKIKLDEEHMYEVIKWNISMLGRSYDIPRAILLLTPFSIPPEQRPEKFFCSQVVMYMIKETNIVEVEEGLDIDHMKPDDVFNWLSEKLNSIKANKNDGNGE